MARISVALIPERPGQLLRQALQERFERFGSGGEPDYDLAVSFGISADAVAFLRDNSSTRTRLIGTATWTLLARDVHRTTVTSGTARDVDGVNIVNAEFFAADLETEVVQRRIAEAIADQIATQLAGYFDRRAIG